jgi:hypothetical protein
VKFDLEPEIGDAQAADGAMMLHGKNLDNMHIFGKPFISGIRKYKSKYVTPKLEMAHNGTKITHGETDKPFSHFLVPFLTKISHN